ncbi:MAG: glycoside hydrolase family 16 protein [Dysgonomonas sp.]|nr:glycoside hydrolase family 16 protein [Dysgonomonas sp.]
MKKREILSILLILFCLSCSNTSNIGKVTVLTDNDIPTTKVLPKGMKLVWNDEFNGSRLDTSKWFTNYYSTLDYVYKTNFDDFKANNLPEPEMEFTGKSIILKVNEEKPEKAFWDTGRKVSSIQTYDWYSNRNHMENSLGGYFEARIKRNAVDSAKQVNVAFWFDSPGPDPRYFVEKGNKALDVEGIRPRGQVFEIDLCEYVTTEIVLHGNVSPKGKFERNIGHYIHKGDFKDKWVTHSMLWTPAGLKFYIDGELVKEWWNPYDIKSSNHMMNMFFGAYGRNGEVTMEVDYVRHYQWQLEKDNHLPNGNFEYDGTLFPWEGTGKITKDNTYNGNYSILLASGDSICQYVYLDHSKQYSLSYYGTGKGSVLAKIENITSVTGINEDAVETVSDLKSIFTEHHTRFRTNPEYGDHKRTVKVSFKNTGNESIILDNIRIKDI